MVVTITDSFIYIQIHDVTLTRHISKMFQCTCMINKTHGFFSIPPLLHLSERSGLQPIFFFPSPVFSYNHGSMGRHIWTKAVWQLSRGPKTENPFPLYIFIMARKTHDHWIILNGQTQNSIGAVT